MERREFLGNLGGPVLAACAVCMGACSKGDSNTSTTPVTPVASDFTVNLSTSLLTIGSSLVQDGVIVVRLAAGNVATSFTAVAVACTHEGTSVNFNSSGNNFVCPNHGSTFTTSGAVILGPAGRALKQFNISIIGTSMKVSG